MNDDIVEGEFGGRPFKGRSERRDLFGAHGMRRWSERSLEPVVQLVRLAHLASLASEIDLLIVTLREVCAERDRALGYLSKPGSNVLLGRALLSRAMSKRSRVTRRLDLDRQWADRLLGEIDAGEESPIET